VTLELQGHQSKMADKVETGAFFSVKHMRLIERIMGVGKVVGRIGGPDRLIHKLNANHPNKELTNLLECVWRIIFLTWNLIAFYYATLQTEEAMEGRRRNGRTV